MFSTSKRAVLFTALLALIGTNLVPDALATKGEGKVDPNKKDDITIKKGDDAINSGANTAQSSDKVETVRFASMPLNSPEIVVVSENARVSVKRMPGLNEVLLFSNCPRDWSIQGSAVRQAGFSTPHKGTGLMSDALGSRAIVQGRIYLLPQQIKGGIKMNQEGVFINGQKIEPLKGSDIPCNCTGDDYLEVRVPESFTGDLKIGSAGKSNIELSNWKNGSFICSLSGSGSISSAGKLEALEKAVIDNRGRGNAEFTEIVAKAVVANVNGDGSVLIKKGSAEMSNATVQGNGKISLPAKYKNLKQSVTSGTGTIEVLP
jgi:hypothetical protein